MFSLLMKEECYLACFYLFAPSDYGFSKNRHMIHKVGDLKKKEK